MSAALRLALLVATLALAAGCASGSTQDAEVKASSSARLTNLYDIDQLRTAFNAKSGVPRLILFLSPT